MDSFDKGKMQWLQFTMSLVSYIFIIEAIIKVIAQGFIMHKNSYLRNPWNIVDFVVLINILQETGQSLSGYENAIPQLTTLRILRVLRPIRTIKRIPQMRKLVSVIFKSVPDMMNTLLFLAFFFLVFSIIGIQANSVILYQRCRMSKLPVNDTYWPQDPTQSSRVCMKSSLLEDPVTMFFEFDYHICKEGTFCASPLEFGLDPLIIDKPWLDDKVDYNSLNFDDISKAFISVLQALTLEGWTNHLFIISDTGRPLSSLIYYYAIILFGSYFLLNLILAVILDSFFHHQNA